RKLFRGDLRPVELGEKRADLRRQVGQGWTGGHTIFLAEASLARFSEHDDLTRTGKDEPHDENARARIPLRLFPQLILAKNSIRPAMRGHVDGFSGWNPGGMRSSIGNLSAERGS